MVKNLPGNAGDAFLQSLGPEDALEKEMATYFSILAWEIPWTEEPGRLQSMGFQRVGHDRVCMCTKYHKLGTLKQQNFFSVTFWRPEV